jgi:hypothetical protein
MQFLAIWCATIAAGSPIDYVYDGPAYVGFSQTAKSDLQRVKGVALAFCVRIGMGPGEIQRMFGAASSYCRESGGPEEWNYFDLGVCVFFPDRMFQRDKSLKPEHLEGGIGP